MQERKNETVASQSPFDPLKHFTTVSTAVGKVELGTLTPLQENHIEAIEARNLDVELMVRLGVGASSRLPGNCIGIPYFDGDKQVGTKYRTIGTGDKMFAQDVGSHQIFWNINSLRDETIINEPIIICEGELDAVAALQAGYHRVVSVPGGAPSQPTSIDEHGKKYSFLDHAKAELDPCRNIILAVDSDGPGLNLLHDLALRLGKHRCRFVRYPRGCKDLGDAIREYGVRGVTESLTRAKYFPVSGIFKMSDLPPIETPPAMNIGIIGLDQHFKMRRGDFTVVTGPPGHGKTSAVNEICCRMAQAHGWKTLFGSFEQSPQVDHRRALRSFYAEKKQRDMTEDELRRADIWIDENFMFIVPNEDEDADLQWVLERAAAGIIRSGAKIVVIDPWNELDHVRPRDLTATEYVGESIKLLRKFARKYFVHLILVAHPAKMQRGKDGKYPMPTLWDISDSAHFANKCDVGIVVYRPNPATDPLTTIAVVKSRYHDQIGRPGEVKGSWDSDRTRYNIADGIDE